MTRDDKVRDVTQAVKGIVEAVPVYEDVVQPAAREIGKGLQTVAKTIHIALAPVAGLVWGYETMRDYLGEALTKRLKGVPTERIITPQAMIAGPALDALKYAGPDPELRELYANLLARAMDERTAQEAHSGFRGGAVLSHAPEGESDWVLRPFSTLGEQGGCAFPGLIATYLDNLCRLGLVGLYEDKRDATPNAYDAPRAHPAVAEAMKQAQVGSRGGTIQEEVLIVTSLGRQFSDAVVLPKPA